MKNYLKHKGYIGTVDFNGTDNCLFGKIMGINDLVSYEAQSVNELKEAFIEAVEDYLITCKQLDKEPEKYFKGSFSVRTGSKRHRTLALLAVKKKMNLNKLVNVAFDYLINNEDIVFEKNN